MNKSVTESETKQTFVVLRLCGQSICTGHKGGSQGSTNEVPGRGPPKLMGEVKGRCGNTRVFFVAVWGAVGEKVDGPQSMWSQSTPYHSPLA